MVNFPTWILDCDSYSPALRDINLLTLVLQVLEGLSLHWQILIMLSQFPLTFCQTQNEMPSFITWQLTYDCFCADWDDLCDYLRDIPWKGIFKLGDSAAAAIEFCMWVQVGIDVYVPHCKYKIIPHSSPWFSAACAAAIIHRNHFFLFVI